METLVEEFMSFSGCSDKSVASYFVEACNGDLSEAFDFYLQSQQTENIVGTENTASEDFISASSNVLNESDDHFTPANAEYAPQSPDVRSADPTVETKLLSNNHKPEFSRAEDPSVDWMFAPPNFISYPGSFIDAKVQARRDKKWIIANIQDHRIFQSHLLNRDVWSHETLISLIRMNYIFWQRGHTSLDAQQFMNSYKIESEELPLICLIDSRTGELVFRIKGVVNVTDLLMDLMQFLEDNNFESDQRVVVRTITSKSNEGVSKSQQNDEVAYEEYDYSDCENEDGQRHSSPVTVEQNRKSNDIPADMVVPRSERESNALKGTDVTIVETQQSLLSVESYGDISPEPEVAQRHIKVSIRLLDGENVKANHNVVRFFNDTDTIKSIFAFVCSLYPSRKHNFDLFTTFPKRSLRGDLGKNIVEAGVNGCQVVMQWLA